MAGIFFVDQGASAAEAKGICARCALGPARLPFALAEEPTHGIWAGLTVDGDVVENHSWMPAGVATSLLHVQIVAGLPWGRLPGPAPERCSPRRGAVGTVR